MDENLENTQTVQSEEQEAASEQQERTFTQAEVNRLVTKESRSAVEKLLKGAGIALEGDGKAQLTAFKKWQENQKTDLEKATDGMQTLQAKNEELAQSNVTLTEQLDALKAGIPADKVERYTKLARAYQTEDTTFINALKLAVKDFPVAENGVSASGGNPAQKPEEQKKSRLPNGVAIF